MNEVGMLGAKAKEEFSDEVVMQNYRKAAAEGLLQVMSKMGISTLQSCKKGAQVFEAVGLADDIVERCFTGTTTRIQGTGFEALYRDLEERFRQSVYSNDATKLSVLVRNGGQLQFRDGGEAHGVYGCQGHYDDC
jgi:glutamate synthase (NADPH/NADH)